MGENVLAGKGSGLEFFRVIIPGKCGCGKPIIS